MNQPRCVDCIAEGVTTARPAHPDSGPRTARCATHHRAWRRRNGGKAHARRIGAVFGITAAQYEALYASQGGRCAICRVATGKARRLAVDHDHGSSVIRGLLCSPCNVMLGRLGVAGLLRAVEYLHDPPAPRVIGRVVVPA